MSEILIVLFAIVRALHLILFDLELLLKRKFETLLFVIVEVCFLDVLIYAFNFEDNGNQRFLLPVVLQFSFYQFYTRTRNRNNFHQLCIFSFYILVFLQREYLPKPTGYHFCVSQMIDAEQESFPVMGELFRELFTVKLQVQVVAVCWVFYHFFLLLMSRNLFVQPAELVK